MSSGTAATTTPHPWLASYFPLNHWQLIDIVAVVSTEPKAVSSEGGHAPGFVEPAL